MTEHSTHSLKTVLLFLLFAFLVILSFVFIEQKGIFDKKTENLIPSLLPSSQTETTKSSAVQTFSLFDLRKEILAVQQKVSAGTLTLEDGNNQIRAIQDQIAAFGLTSAQAQMIIKAIQKEVKDKTLTPEEGDSQIRNIQESIVPQTSPSVPKK